MTRYYAPVLAKLLREERGQSNFVEASTLDCFFYLLMRDWLPCGAVAEMVQQIEKAGSEFDYSNEELVALARQFVNRLLDKGVTLGRTEEIKGDSDAT